MHQPAKHKSTARSSRQGKGNQELEQINPNAAGIDLGADAHWVLCATRTR